MNIDIICPLYNAENYIVDLQKSIELQSKYGNINNIRYIITKGKDNTEKLVEQIKEKNNKVLYKKIEAKKFSHSLTRENEAKEFKHSKEWESVLEKVGCEKMKQKNQMPIL